MQPVERLFVREGPVRFDNVTVNPLGACLCGEEESVVRREDHTRSGGETLVNYFLLSKRSYLPNTAWKIQMRTRLTDVEVAVMCGGDSTACQSAGEGTRSAVRIDRNDTLLSGNNAVQCAVLAEH